jgi:AMP nucleosidase
MPAYHLVRHDRAGITMVNIGVGPGNAKTMTDHIAVLRPHAWIMLGHCAGLRTTQQRRLRTCARVRARGSRARRRCAVVGAAPPLAEVQLALEAAVADVTQLRGYELKRIMRTGTVAAPTIAPGAAATAHADAPFQPKSGDRPGHGERDHRS